MSDLVGQPENRFFRDASHTTYICLSLTLKNFAYQQHNVLEVYFDKENTIKSKACFEVILLTYMVIENKLLAIS